MSRKRSSRSVPERKPEREIGEVGEEGLVGRIGRFVDRHATHASSLVLGLGDDAALLRPASGHDMVVSTDALVEDVHFRFRTQGATTIGRRALLVSLSDLAAMGAKPMGCTLALSAPPTLSLSCFDGIFEGLAHEAARSGCPLVGGNLSRGLTTQLTVTVLGQVRRGRALRRDAARPGDSVFVTGTIGDGALALARSEVEDVRLRHLPRSRVTAGLALGRRRDRGACIDVSDGLTQDLLRVLQKSACGAEIQLEKIPLRPGFASRCRRLGLDPDLVATAGGGDYELLFTLRDAGATETALAGALDTQVTRIGQVVRGTGVSGLPGESARGFMHF